MESEHTKKFSTTAVQESVSVELERLEVIVEGARPKPKEHALALLDIHDQRLYLSGYCSFSDYLWKRWEIRRSRGYQLIAWARILRVSPGAQPSDPVNERQARRVKGQDKKQDWTTRAMDYIVKAWEALPGAERREFIKALRALLKEMEQELGRALNDTATG